MLVGYSITGNLAPAQPKVHSDSILASAGYFQLTWQDPTTDHFLLQQANNPTFTDAVSLYQGSDRARVISGLADGDYFYRVQGQDGSWSEPLKVRVQHHPLDKALAFFGLGAAMFVALVAVLLTGTQRKS